ncbi:MAG: hypothetical protein KGR48_03110 [Alphaproteobacteria bacterium]|nr:hypothetical protein [Alphaproteobacteria bacterium]MBU6471181.1 hypothetical protein [Alphaproteobacteria bacterium]MDE2013900.1 hypothetical protein [Alphaproteobacteria bacterium]MDE2073071.1 hypothetical protein [Alphaproteobacteria bacterium]MDE2351777.1 hypothetical protein [Alphaproteobacteria bacterium]
MLSRKLIAAVVGAAGIMMAAEPALAGDLASQFRDCVSKYANNQQSVSVMLQCTAANGKLSDCKVTDAPSPANGFDKAAICVADILPIGDKTGSVKVPIRFEKSS